MENNKLKEEAETKKERQKFQMHQKGYNDIVEAIKSIPETKIPEINLTETNKILSQLVEQNKEPICINLILE